jgi:hypothetical protein
LVNRKPQKYDLARLDENKSWSILEQNIILSQNWGGMC